VSRRLYDAGASYDFAQPVLHWNRMSSYGAWALGLAQIPFIINFFWSMRQGRRSIRTRGGRPPSNGRRVAAAAWQLHDPPESSAAQYSPGTPPISSAVRAGGA
jgi:heme/copper-type cytochrome/quinol oxidase subunit 1